MKHSHWLPALALSLASALAVGGCGDDDDDVPQPTGFVAIDWTIAGRVDADLCTASGAVGVQIVVYNAMRIPVGQAEAPCADPVVSVELPVGSYTAEAYLENAQGLPVQPVRTLGTFEIRAGVTTSTQIDFPFAVTAP